MASVRNPQPSHSRNKLVIDQHKSPCAGCGEDRIPCLEFHHIDPETKVFNVSMAWRKKGTNAILRELAKCIVVCANCHKLIHAGWLEVQPDGSVKESPHR